MTTPRPATCDPRKFRARKLREILSIWLEGISAAMRKSVIVDTMTMRRPVRAAGLPVATGS